MPYFRLVKYLNLMASPCAGTSLIGLARAMGIKISRVLLLHLSIKGKSDFPMESLEVFWFLF